MSLIAIERKIAALELQMQRAAEAEDFEMAARLRNQIPHLTGQSAAKAQTPVVRQPPPGQMGLGTHIPVAEPPSGWKKPKKPDPMTRATARPRRPGKR